jgi:hypothetical protein
MIAHDRTRLIGRLRQSARESGRFGFIHEKDGPSLVHFHVAAQKRGFASLLHSLSLVLAPPCAKGLPALAVIPEMRIALSGIHFF